MANHKAIQDKCFSRMVRFIESRIAAGDYRPGDRLPPLRYWCETFQLDLNAARRGMWYLRDKNLLECRPGSGVYVRDVKDTIAVRPEIGIVIGVDDPSRSYCAHVVLGIRELAALQSLPLTTCTGIQPFEELLEHQEELDAFQSIIMLGNYDVCDSDFSWLRRPAVGVEMHRMFNGIFSVISMDPFNAAELAKDYFLKHGRNKVIIADVPTPLHRCRAQVFRNIFEAAGGSVMLASFNDAAGAEKLFNTPDTAFLFTSGTFYQNTAAMLNRDLAHEYCLISMDGKSEILPGYLPVTTITPDWRQIGFLALEEAARRGKTPGNMAKRIYADVSLIER